MSVAKWIVLGAWLLAPAQEDRVRVREKDGRIADVSCSIRTLSLDKVEVTVEEDGRKRNVSYDGNDVLEVSLGQERTSETFQEGSLAAQEGDLAEAVQKYLAAARSEKDRVVQQVAYMEAAWAAARGGMFDEAGQIIQELRTKIGDTWFLEKTYRLQFQIERSRGNQAAAERALEQFADEGRKRGKRDWQQTADLLRAELAESAGELDRALAIYQKYSRGTGSVSGEAAAGELRCLSAKKDLIALRSRAEDVLRRGVSGVGPRAITAAYNAMGDIHDSEGRVKEALLAYLRGICEFDEIRGTREHAYSLAMSALLCARYGATLADPKKKEAYAQHAQRLYGELRATYPDYDRDGSLQRRIQKHLQ